MSARAINCWLFGVSISTIAGALVYRTSNAAVSANADIPFQSEVYDSDAYFTVGTSAANFVAPATGLYRCQINVSTNSTTGSDATKSYKNGAGFVGGHVAAQAGASGLAWGNGASAVLSLNASDLVKSQNAFNTRTYGWDNDGAYSWHAIEPLAAATKYALVYPSASISITSGAWRTNGYNTEIADTDSIHDTATNNSRLTVPSGVTRARLSWGAVTSNATFSVRVSCAKNGTSNCIGAPIRSKGGGGNKLMSAVGPPLAVTAGDYFEHQIYSSANITILNDPYSWFCLESVPASIQSCIAKKTSNQTLTTAYADVTFDADEYDDSAIHDTTTNTERFVVPSGCTRARFHFGTDPSASSGTVSCRTKVNGGYVAGGTGSEATTASYGSLGLSTPWLPVVGGDYFTIEAKTTSGTVTIGIGTWGALECE